MEVSNSMLIECQCCFSRVTASEISTNTCKAEPKHIVCDNCFKKSRVKECIYCNPLNDNNQDVEVYITEFDIPYCNKCIWFILVCYLFSSALLICFVYIFFTLNN